MLDTQPVTIFRHCFEYYYPHMPIGKVRIYQLLFFVCLFVYVCLYGYVRLRISPLMIKLAASTFARWFIRVLGRKSPSLGNFAAPEASPQAQNRTNRLRRPRSAAMARTTRACARTTRRIGMCGYTVVPEDLFLRPP